MSAFEDKTQSHLDKPDLLDFIATLCIVLMLVTASMWTWSRVPFLQRIARKLIYGNEATDEERLHTGAPLVDRMKRD
jgi:hypothetical protein